MFGSWADCQSWHSCVLALLWSWGQLNSVTSTFSAAIQKKILLVFVAAATANIEFELLVFCWKGQRKTKNYNLLRMQKFRERGQATETVEQCSAWWGEQNRNCFGKLRRFFSRFFLLDLANVSVQMSKAMPASHGDVFRLHLHVADECFWKNIFLLVTTRWALPSFRCIHRQWKSAWTSESEPAQDGFE